MLAGFGLCSIDSVLDDDNGAFLIFLDQPEEGPCVLAAQPHATVGSTSTKTVFLVGTVRCDIAVEEDRMRHRGVVVNARTMMFTEPLHLKGAVRRPTVAFAGRDFPVVEHFAIFDDAYSLLRLVDDDTDAGCRFGQSSH